MPPLPHPDEVPSLVADGSISPDLAASFLAGCGLYWRGPRKVTSADHDAWRQDMKDELLVAGAMAIYSNLADPSEYSRLPWASLHTCLGPLPPGEVWAIGAREGGGKSTFLINWINALYQQRESFTLLALEQGPDEILRKLGALRTAIPYAKLSRGDTEFVHYDDYDRLNTEVRTIAADFASLGVRLAPDRRLSIPVLTTALERAGALGHSLVVVDHIHRLDVSGSHEQETLSALMRLAKDAAHRLNLTVVFTAQLNRTDNSRLAPFHPPKLSDFRGSATIGMESDVVMGLWRPMQPLTAKQTRQVECGDREPREFVVPHRMATVCLKHRRDDRAFMRQIRLHVQHGVIRDLTAYEMRDDSLPLNVPTTSAPVLIEDGDAKEPELPFG
jgi:KaiC/GvpD/RAD55 family RecA-like ATPase